LVVAVKGAVWYCDELQVVALAHLRSLEMLAATVWYWAEVHCETAVQVVLEPLALLKL
jgi:hypothetical protein